MASDISRPAGITIPAIDRCYDNLPNVVTFRADECGILTSSLKRAADCVREVATNSFPEEQKASSEREDQGTRAELGFLFAHRLVRECVPDYFIWVSDPREVSRRLSTGLASLERATTGRSPELEARFSRTPEVFDHLLRKFTNPHSSFGAQSLLLCLPEHLALEVPEPALETELSVNI